MKGRKYYILISFIFSLFSVYSDNVTDSLKKLLAQQKVDTLRSQSAYRISWSYFEAGDLDSAKKYSEYALKIATKAKSIFGKAVSTQYLGAIYNALGKYHDAELYYKESFKLWKKLDDKIGLIDVNIGLANVQNNLANYNEALIYYNNAILEARNINDKKKENQVKINIATVYLNKADFRNAFLTLEETIEQLELVNDLHLLTSCYINLGIVFAAQNNSEKALENYAKALKICSQTNDKSNTALAYNNIGDIFLSKKKLSIALKNLLKASEIYEVMGDVKNLSHTYHNIGNVFTEKKELKNALYYHEKALAFREKIYDRRGMALSYISISNIFLAKKDYSKALYYTQLSLDLSKDIKAYDVSKDCYKTLDALYAELKDYKNARINLKYYIEIKDSLLNKESVKLINEINTRYETDKKQLLITNLEKEQTLQKAEVRSAYIQKIASLSGLLLVLIIAVIIFRNNRVKQKTNLLLTKQNSLIDKQKQLVEEKHKEITDSINYAERIQRALLASEKLLDENLSDYFIFFKPKDVVSGDFYWATKLSNNHFVLVTADSTGHGVPGAIMSILNIACLDKAVTKEINSPDLILNETRSLIIDHLKNDGTAEGGKDGMDGSLLSFDFKNSVLHCASANNPIWVIRNKELIEIKADRLPIGKHDKDKTPFTLHTLNLQKGDVAYTLTDGFPDQFGGAKGKKFKHKQLQELLLSIANDPMETQKQKLNDVFDNWKGNLEQVDDVCLIGVRV
ncbi:MAG: tetratricopeptide repeat protein [Bacteroidetes bacterium]|nr:tetratricopeptide repeat protein [Bacteroidota bacterium]